jgi:hypothetical protein
LPLLSCCLIDCAMIPSPWVCGPWSCFDLLSPLNHKGFGLSRTVCGARLARAPAGWLPARSRPYQTKFETQWGDSVPMRTKKPSSQNVPYREPTGNLGNFVASSPQAAEVSVSQPVGACAPRARLSRERSSPPLVFNC